MSILVRAFTKFPHQLISKREQQNKYYKKKELFFEL